MSSLPSVEDKLVASISFPRQLSWKPAGWKRALSLQSLSVTSLPTAPRALLFAILAEVSVSVQQRGTTQCSKGRKGTCRVFTLISLRNGLPVCFRGTLPPQDCTWASETILGVIWHSEWGWGLFWEKQCLNPGHLRFRGIFKMTCKPSFCKYNQTLLLCLSVPETLYLYFQEVNI